MRRLSAGGLIDRGKSLSFSFDGQKYTGHPGDTLASALLANNIRLVGRSFKYHRPRGIMTAGSDEPNALMGIGEGADLQPNTKATTQELFDGLISASQHRWPSLKRDFGEINDVMSRFLGAGFYYKTFMWPSQFWEKVYEPLIRRAAGLGQLSGEPDLTLYDKAWAHCDVLIVGGGPAGIMAALVAGRAGVRVILADEDFAIGGRCLSETTKIDDQVGPEWVSAQLAELGEMSNVRIMPRTTITGAFDGGTYGALERVADHAARTPDNVPRQIFWRIVAKRVILAAGALERMIAFPGNDRPGVMLSGAVRSYATRFGVAPGKRVAIFTNNNDGWRTARDLDLAGVEIAALIDTRDGVDPKAATARIIKGGQVVATKGRMGLQEITVRTASGIEKLEVDCLAVSGGWNPALHLSSHLGARPVWQDSISAFVPAANAIPGMVAIGAAAGDLSTQGALTGGVTEAAVIVREFGLELGDLTVPKADSSPVAITPFWQVQAEGRAWLDFQNDVTTHDLQQAHQENFQSIEHMKRYTTLGMGTDQGKIGNVTALAVMAELTGTGVGQAAPTTFRPPYTPVQIGAMGANGAGQGFAPIRTSPIESWVEPQRLPLLDIGLWKKPAYFPRDGENRWRQSVDREVAMVRQSVGVCDFSSLGKFDLQGPDAGAFVDRIFCNDMASLKVGRMRYGLVLRDDGFAMDDGTCARLEENRYLMTSSTGAAEQVLSHLEFCAQCLWPELEVHIHPVTEHWAQIAIAGPKAREIVERIFKLDLSIQALPFMTHREYRIGKITARIFQLSYTGENGFEIAVPARFGAWLMAELVANAEGGEGGAFGLEAVNVLRMEKGFLSHAEINGQTTAGDLGMGHLLPADKNFIGKIAGQRPGLNGPERAQLVGLMPVGAVKLVKAGAHLIVPQDAKTLQNDCGHVTSACFSPSMDSTIALALLQNGRARIGSNILAVDMVREIETLCEVVHPCFFDPNGGRRRE